MISMIWGLCLMVADNPHDRILPVLSPTSMSMAAGRFFYSRTSWSAYGLQSFFGHELQVSFARV